MAAEPISSLLTLDQVAARVNVSRRTVRRYVERGELAAIRLPGLFRFDPPEVERFIDKRRVGESR